MSKYFTHEQLAKMDEYRKQIYDARAKMFAEFEVDALDTDALSSLAIYNIVHQYDPDFNVNFTRNGEDAKSGNVLIEQKASRVDPSNLTATGKIRVGFGRDATFAFHAMGKLDHPRYLFVARSKVDLSILRVYDITSKANRKVVLDKLMSERERWEDKNKELGYTQTHDGIYISEKLILKNCNFPTQTIINGSNVFRD
jgi:hypothetical protein